MTMAETSNKPSLTPEFSRIVNMMRLKPSQDYNFHEVPTLDEALALKDLFEVISVKKMRFEGALKPLDSKGWVLEAKLGATVSQACVLTLETIRTRIDIDVRRIFLPEIRTSSEVISLDTVEDDETERLESQLDLGLIAIEALALAIPEYPKAEGASLDNSTISPPNSEEIVEEKVNPFADLAALKEKLENND